MGTDAGEVTVLLKAVREGVPGAADRLMSIVYDQLKRIARARARDSGSLLEPTTLVQETYLRMFDTQEASWDNRRHFFWAAARAMRDILVEEARRRGAQKRGGGRKRIDLEEIAPTVSDGGALLELTECLHRFEAAHPDLAQLVMLRFFAGLKRDQLAELTGMSPAAVWREWAFAKAWILADLEDDSGRPEPEIGQ